MLIAISILIAMGSLVVAAGLPPETVPMPVAFASYAILAGVAGLLLRIVSPTAGRIALAALAVGSIVGVMLFEAWFLLVITHEDSMFIRPPEIPHGWAIVETIWRTGLIQILPIVTGLLFGILLHDSIEIGIRSRRRRRASLEAT
ncbi:MAG: hypothetical protein GY704_01400 [Phycisphaeraceae bacterium]|nr:hypothetical protein [Phycisphaeraceae bacterium]